MNAHTEDLKVLKGSFEDCEAEVVCSNVDVSKGYASPTNSIPQEDTQQERSAESPQGDVVPLFVTTTVPSTPRSTKKVISDKSTPEFDIESIMFSPPAILSPAQMKTSMNSFSRDSRGKVNKPASVVEDSVCWLQDKSYIKKKKLRRSRSETAEGSPGIMGRGGSGKKNQASHSTRSFSRSSSVPSSWCMKKKVKKNTRTSPLTLRRNDRRSHTRGTGQSSLSTLMDYWSPYLISFAHTFSSSEAGQVSCTESRSQGMVRQHLTDKNHKINNVSERNEKFFSVVGAQSEGVVATIEKVYNEEDSQHALIPSFSLSLCEMLSDGVNEDNGRGLGE